MKRLEDVLSEKKYPGRGIVIGKSDDGKSAVCAYFIMGRSENSRNRVFLKDGDGIRTECFDKTKLTDPSLIIYSPVRMFERMLIVTNGNQTDTVYDFLKEGKSFEEALMTRTFEPDEPNFTPRISGLIDMKEGFKGFKLSILKSDSGNPKEHLRYFFNYTEPEKGRGRFIHTYMEVENLLPSFSGEPVKVELKGSIDEFTNNLWNSLNSDNRISLFTRFTNIETGEAETRILNKNI